MISLSTHVIDASAGAGRSGIAVRVHEVSGDAVGDGITDGDGRIAALATDLSPGSYRVSWQTGGGFLAAVAVTVDLAEDRHYHLPLLVTDVSAVSYLGV